MGDLIDIYETYRRDMPPGGGVWADLKALYGRHVREREQTILDAAASGLALNAMLANGEIDMDLVTPQMQEAFTLAFPSHQLADLRDVSSESLEGFVNAWKGKLFEVEVRDRLMDGQWVGDLHLEPGQTAQLAESLTQPGWDLSITGGDGLVDQLQLKATESLSYVKEALERYPGTDILTTSELAHQLAPDLAPSVTAVDISDADLTHAVSAPFEQDLLHHVLPGLPLALIALTEGYGVVTGKRSASQAVRRSGSRVAKSVLAGAIGWGLGLLLGDVTGVVGAVAVRMFLGGEREDAPTVDFGGMAAQLERAKATPQLLLPYYP